MESVNIAVTENITLVNLSQAPADVCFCASLFEAFTVKNINVDMISQNPPQGSYTPLSFTISEDDFERALCVIAEIREVYPEIKISVSGGNSKLLIYSEEMRDNPGFAAKVFRASALCGADIRMITTSETEISLLFCGSQTILVSENIRNAFSE